MNGVKALIGNYSFAIVANGRLNNVSKRKTSKKNNYFQKNIPSIA